jgi:hypothetical protein
MIKADYKYLVDAPPKSKVPTRGQSILLCVVFILISIDWDSIPI